MSNLPNDMATTRYPNVSKYKRKYDGLAEPNATTSEKFGYSERRRLNEKGVSNR